MNLPYSRSQVRYSRNPEFFAELRDVSLIWQTISSTSRLLRKKRQIQKLPIPSACVHADVEEGGIHISLWGGDCRQALSKSCYKLFKFIVRALNSRQKHIYGKWCHPHPLLLWHKLTFWAFNESPFSPRLRGNIQLDLITEASCSSFSTLWSHLQMHLPRSCYSFSVKQ